MEHEDSAQIAVTLASEWNQGQEREKELGCPALVFQNPFVFQSQEKHRHTHTHIYLQPAHVVNRTVVAVFAEQKSR